MRFHETIPERRYYGKSCTDLLEDPATEAVDDEDYGSRTNMGLNYRGDGSIHGLNRVNSEKDRSLPKWIDIGKGLIQSFGPTYTHRLQHLGLRVKSRTRKLGRSDSQLRVGACL